MRMYKNGDWLACGSIVSPDVGKISWYKPENFTDITRWDNTNQPVRILGQYSLGTAKAELTLDRRHNENGRFETWEYSLDLNCTRLEDGQELYILIRAGRISPNVPYDGAQSKNVARHFKDLFREFLVLCRVTLQRWEIIG